MNTPGTNRTLFTTAGAFIAWFALIAQLFFSIENRTTSVTEAIIRFISYFTILTNLLVALYFTTLLLPGTPRLKRFFQRPGALTAIAVYITVVGIVYQVLLRHSWSPQGFQLVVDELLHSVIPVLVLLYWVLYEDRRKLKWRFMLLWLAYPLAYAIYTVIRGYFSGFYPYPFIDLNQLSYQHVLTNTLGLFVVFFFFSGAFIGIGKLMVKR
jgi:hypothetical protein